MIEGSGTAQAVINHCAGLTYTCRFTKSNSHHYNRPFLFYTSLCSISYTDCGHNAAPMWSTHRDHVQEKHRQICSLTLWSNSRCLVLGNIKNIQSRYIDTSNVTISWYIDMCLLESINLNYLVSMAIKPCDHCLKLSCDYCQYCMSLLVVTILQTEVYKWPQIRTNGSVCCCYARNVRRL